ERELAVGGEGSKSEGREGRAPTTTNTAKELEAVERVKALGFQAFVSAARCKVRELFRPAVGPSDDRAVDPVASAHAEGHRQLRLRQIARPALDEPRLRRAGGLDGDQRADRVAIRRGAGQQEP